MSSSRVAIVALSLVFVSRISWTQDGCGGPTPSENQAQYNLRNSSRHGSPLQIAGYVTVQDNPAKNVRSYWIHASAKNTTTKGIAAWSASLETAGGGGPHLNLTESHDFFFTGDVLTPSQAEKVNEESCPISLVLRVPNANLYAAKAEPTGLPRTASVRVKFVQFTDGSIWGDRDEAAKAQFVRRETLHKIESLQQVYSEQGEKAFMDALSEPLGLPCVERIKALCRGDNTDSSCARKTIEGMLKIAARQRQLDPL